MASEEVGAEALVRLVADAGITVCFANPGTTEMHVVDALGASAIRSVLGLHENVVTGAADGFARMARRPAMTLLHLGPGLANGLANLHNARRAGSPVFSVVGDMAVWHSAAEAPLKMDVQALAHTVSCWVGTPRTPLWLRPLVREGLAHCAAPAAAGCSRVCTLVLPHDVQWEPVDQRILEPGGKALLNVHGGLEVATSVRAILLYPRTILLASLVARTSSLVSKRFIGPSMR